MSNIYSQAARVLASVVLKRNGLKSACFTGNVNVKVVYALIQKVLPNYRRLEKEIRKVKVPNKYLAVVMLYDYWATGKVSGGGYLKKLIMTTFPNAKPLVSQKNSTIWVRVNRFNPCENIEEIGKKDELIEGLYLANRSQETTKLIDEYHVIAQSKASCMPVAALDLVKGNWNAIDTCAAPGNKTIQLAENMKKFTTGVLFAFEKDEKRFNLLKSRILKAKADNIIAKNEDFFNVTDFSNVKIAIVDPSCSGSGIIEHQMVDHGKIHYDFEYSDDRIVKLSEFQGKILKKVLKIPGIEQVVYSTCSVYLQENEFVVEKALESCWKRFKLGKALEKWQDRGFGPFGKYMARSVPTSNNSQGFFIAKLIKRKLRLQHKLHKRSYKYWLLRKKAKYT